MERRAFVQTSLAVGVLGMGGTSRLAPLERRVRSPRTATPIRLNSNENPLGLAPVARRAVIDAIPDANRYPDESEHTLIAVLAAKHAVAPEQIVLGAGSTEVLQMLVQSTVIVGGTVVVPTPTFEDVEEYAAPFPAGIVKVPLDARFAHDVGRMRQRASDAAHPVLVYICNPNNPTGTVTPCGEIDEWIGSAPEETMFVVDEAYFEYVDDPRYWSSIRWVSDHLNVVVARTFSKIYGMAGMRLGYGIAHPKTAERMRQFISHNSANQLALVAALASLNDEGLVARGRAANTEGKRILRATLDDLGLEYLPSETNFLMHRIPGEVGTYIGRMRDHGVRVGRPFPPMLSYNRVSIGTVPEMERFAEVLRSFREQGWV